MAALPHTRSRAHAAAPLRGLAAGAPASEEGLRELEPETAGAAPAPALRPFPGDLAALRERLARGRDLLPVAPPPEELFPTGIPALDAVLAGGLARGLLTELRGAPSSGRLSLVLALLATATGRGEPAALIDLGDHLDPQTAVAAGVDLGRLLWVRPTRLREALSAAEIALSGAFPLVVLELGGAPVRGRAGARRGSDEHRDRDQHAWLRLARAARHHRGALLVSAPYRLTGSAAAEVLVLSRRRGVWLGSGAAPRVLLGVDSRLQREKSRRQPEPGRGSRSAGAAVVWRAVEAVQGELPWGPLAARADAAAPDRRPPAATSVEEAVTSGPRRGPADPPRAVEPAGRPEGPRRRPEPRREPAAAPAAARDARRGLLPVPAARGETPAGGNRLSTVAAAVAARTGRPPRSAAARPRRVPGWVPLARAALAESLRDAPPPRGRA